MRPDNRVLIRSFLARRWPSLAEELGSDVELAAELIGVLYDRARRGKPYIEMPVGGESAALAVLQDEARRLYGSSSIIGGLLSMDGVAQVIQLLRSAGIVFLRRYGPVYKLRVDKEFERELREAEGLGARGACG